MNTIYEDFLSISQTLQLITTLGICICITCDAREEITLKLTSLPVEAKIVVIGCLNRSLVKREL